MRAQHIRAAMMVAAVLGFGLAVLVMVACPNGNAQEPVPEAACLLTGNAQLVIVAEVDLAVTLDDLFIQCATILAVTSQKDGADTLYTVAYRISKTE